MSDRLLTISEGKSRYDKVWSNREVTWNWVVDKLSNTIVTYETAADYAAMPKARQDQIKDVGGFVGGFLVDGKRGNGTVKFRSILTLDVDFATADFWDGFTCLNDFEALIYSTHKCSPKRPRYRLVAPLSRNVTDEEYGAISRRVAQMVGIDMFDDTTYQPSRLMYYPSTSSDAEFIFQHQVGDWIDVDDVLASYDDWHDVSSWPVSSRATSAVKARGGKQADPTQKAGTLGVFCRCYSIEDAIEEFLSDVYKPCAENRYTYINGSTVGGLVVYDHVFAYSNHATDPASMRLCNAWDLVRIHKFGQLDVQARVDCPVNKLPSYKAMTDFALEQPCVRQALTVEHVQEATQDFKSVEPAKAEKNFDFARSLSRSKNGIDCTVENFRNIIMNDPNLDSIKGLDEFSGQNVVTGALPWDATRTERFWTDTDDSGLRWYIEKVYQLAGKDKCYDALSTVLKSRAFHPVRDYLNALEWDGQPRLDTLLVTYMGAEDTRFTRAATRKALVAACKRIFEPGCKFDYMLVLIGEQGQRKSTLLRTLGGKWFSDTLTTVSGKEAYEELNGVWILEVGELGAVRKAEVEATKQFISKQVDTYRPAYGRRVVSHARQCVFIGTTNDREFLHDPTGNRRYWNVTVGVNRPQKSVTEDLTQDVVDQIFAEAMVRYRGGEAVYMDTAELERDAVLMQKAHTEENAKAGMVVDFLETPLPTSWNDMNLYDRREYLNGSELINPKGDGVIKRDRVCAAEILCEKFGMDPGRISKFDTREINDIMRNVEGWVRTDYPIRFPAPYGKQRGFVRVGLDDVLA